MAHVRLCTATHPDYPNRSGLARGRKVHIVKPGQNRLTICGMLVDEFCTREGMKHTVFSDPGRDCKNCFCKVAASGATETGVK